MLRAIINAALALCIFCVAAATLAGFLAPLAPFWEMANHFRPLIIAGLCILLTATVLMRVWPLTLAVLLVGALNVCLAALPLFAQAQAASPPADGRFRLVTFNVLAGNRRFENIEIFLRTEDADMVVLQEVTAGHDDKLLPRLRDLYPYQLSCGRTAWCHLAILSKRPWADAQLSPGGATRPPLAWARFGTGEGAWRMAATHFVTPLRADDQVNHTRWLTDWRATIAEPVIIAGDFNLTPFSWRLSKFAWDTGLRRYATYQTSWPATGYRTAFLIDHIFSSDAFHPIEVRTGPYLGSDHLPVIADIAFDGALTR